jgi:hypothetical protein
VLETVLRRRESNCKDLAVCSQTSAQYGTPDCPVVHRTVSGAPGWSSVNSPLSGFDGGVRLKITGLSGGAPDYPVSCLWRTRRSREKHHGDVAKIHRTVRWCTGLSGEPTVGRTIFARHVDCSNGQLVVHQSDQRSNDRICQIWKEITHRTVRCATRQKARIAFHVDLQRLLAALGL